MSQTLGELIRERRLGRGLSLGQLASEVATSANQVRRWERGEEIPGDDEQSVLGEFLDIDATDLALLATVAAPPIDEDPEPPESPTELVSAAAGVSLMSVSQPKTKVRVEELERPQEPVEPEGPPAPSEPAQVLVDAPASETPLGPVVISSPAVPAVDPDAPHPVPLRYPESAPPGVAVEISEAAPNPWNPLRYLYDPDKPWLYWVRAGLTVIVLLILLNILFDSVGELFDKLGEVIDSIGPVEVVEGDEGSSP